MRPSRLPTLFFLTLLLIFLLSTCARAQMAPPNDDFANATVVASLPFTDDVAVADASLAADDSALLDCADGIHSFWYSFTPSVTGLYRIASGVAGATEVLPANDLTLGLFLVNADVTVTSTLECEQDDQTNGGGERFFTTLNADVTYYVRVALVEATTGDEVITTSIEYVEEVTFTGAQDPLWDNPDNWLPARVPTASDKVIIPGNAINPCFIGSEGGIIVNAEARMIEIENNSLWLFDGNRLTVASGVTGISLEGLNEELSVAGQLTVRDMTSDGINLTNGSLFIEETGELLLENIGDDGLQSTDGVVVVRNTLTILDVADNGMVIGGGLTVLAASNSTLIEDIADHGTTVFDDGELHVQGELTIERVGRDGISTNGGKLIVSESGVVNIETVGEFGLGDADFVNDGYLRIDGTVEDGIDTDVECTNNGHLLILNAGEDGLDIQDDSTFVNNGYLEVDSAGDKPIIDGHLLNAAEGELVFNGSMRSETTYANGSRLSVGPGVGSGSFFIDPVLDSVTLVADIEGNMFGAGNDDFWTVGDFDLADSKLELAGSYQPQIGETFDIVSASQGNILGTFEGLPEGSSLTFNGVEMRISYLGGNQNVQTVELTAISLPTFTWTGAEDTDWSNANNWDIGQVPGAIDSVYIPATANDPTFDRGFAVVGAVHVAGGRLTVADGSIITIVDRNTGLTIEDAGEVIANGFLDIRNQPGKGLDIVNGFLIVNETGEVIVDNTFAELNQGGIEVYGDMIISDAVNVGFHSVGDGFVAVLGTGLLEIEAATGDGVVLSNETALLQQGTTTITNCGGNGINVGAGLTLTIGMTGNVIVTGCSGNGFHLANSATAVVNNGLLTVADNGGSAFAGGMLTNNPSGTLRTEGIITSAVVIEDGSRLEPGSSPGCLTFTKPVDLQASTLVIEIEETGVCSEYDQVVFEAGVMVSEATLELAGGYEPVVGAGSFTIAREQSFGGFPGGFAGLPDGSTIILNGIVLEVSYENNSTTFEDEVVLRAVGILPLYLLSFTGETRDKTNLLTWTTANEEDFSHFEIERSSAEAGAQRPDSSADRWEVIAEIKSRSSSADASGLAPASADERSYTFEDEATTAYYRLKMIDLDGTFSYSEMVFLEHHLGAAAGAMSVYPNPSDGRFTVDLTKILPATATTGKLRLMDVQGRTVWSGSATETTQQLTIQLPETQPGVYLLTYLANGERISAARVVVW